MAIFVGYGDESGKQDDPQSTSSAYGILVGPNECWDSFDSAWKEALSKAGIDYFHRKEFGIPNGPYAALDPAKEQQLYTDFIEAMKIARLEAYATAVRHAALDDFEKKTGLRLDAYALSLYTCLGHIWFQHEQRNDITLYLDWVENKARKMASVVDYIATDPVIPDFIDWINGIEIHHAAKPKPGDKISKVPGYQAADFLAWETRKYIHTSPEDERKHAADGVIRPMGWPPPRRRKSLNALNEARPIRGSFWDMEVLENAHTARGGIWKP